MTIALKKPVDGSTGKWVRSLRDTADSQPDYLIAYMVRAFRGQEAGTASRIANKKAAASPKKGSRLRTKKK